MTEEFSIGKTFKTGPLGQRDAVHAAVVLVKSKELVYPGDSLVFEDSEFTIVKPVRHPGPRNEDDWELDEEDEDELKPKPREGVEEDKFGNPILRRQAIADPNISEASIKAGELFWAFLAPGSTVGLRHVFDIVDNKEIFKDPYDNRADAENPCRGCY